MLWSILGWIIIGGLAGWIAGELMRGHGFGFLGNVITGILGAVIGGWLFNSLGVATSYGFIGSLFTATVGAIVLLFITGLLRRTAS